MEGVIVSAWMHFGVVFDVRAAGPWAKILSIPTARRRRVSAWFCIFGVTEATHDGQHVGTINVREIERIPQDLIL
jgi:hypothetical protein